MKFSYITLFPEIISAFFQNSIMKRAVESGAIQYSIIPLQNFAAYHASDDAPYGGGAGMLLKSEPLAAALESAGAHEKFCIYPSPSGFPMQQKIAQALSRLSSESFLNELKKNIENFPCQNTAKIQKKIQENCGLKREIIFICGRYEGIDQRIIDNYVDLELSIGDYVLSSGELSSLCLTDAIYRLCDGIISRGSLELESFSNGLLEHPQYTRPEVFCGQRVPEVLLSGHHEKIRLWQLEKSVERTARRRPELLQQNLSTEIQKLVQQLGTKKEQ